MEVTSKTGVFYKGERHEKDEPFEISKEDYERDKKHLVIVEEEKSTNLTLAGLRAIAKEKKIPGYHNMGEVKLVAALEALEGGGDGGSGNSENASANQVPGQE